MDIRFIRLAENYVNNIMFGEGFKLARGFGEIRDELDQLNAATKDIRENGIIHIIGDVIRGGNYEIYHPRSNYSFIVRKNRVVWHQIGEMTMEQVREYNDNMVTATAIIDEFYDENDQHLDVIYDQQDGKLAIHDRSRGCIVHVIGAKPVTITTVGAPRLERTVLIKKESDSMRKDKKKEVDGMIVQKFGDMLTKLVENISEEVLNYDVTSISLIAVDESSDDDDSSIMMFGGVLTQDTPKAVAYSAVKLMEKYDEDHKCTDCGKCDKGGMVQ